jgi:hypothetical protein
MSQKPYLAFAMSFLIIAGCAGRRVITDPTFQPQIINQTNSFALQATNISGVTQTIQYTWQNTGSSANVNQATVLTGGSATLTIMDAAGQQVYTNSVTANGTFQTSSGMAGNWTIRLVVSNGTGTLNFRVQKP